MTKNCFKIIHAFLHFADNTDDTADDTTADPEYDQQ